MKKLMKILPAIFIFQVVILLVLNFRCDRRSASKPLDEKVFVQVYCDVVTYADLVDTKRREALVDSVMNCHHISREQFQNAVSAYSRDDKKWEKVFAKIVAELERREKEMGANADSVKAEGE